MFYTSKHGESKVHQMGLWPLRHASREVLRIHGIETTEALLQGNLRLRGADGHKKSRIWRFLEDAVERDVLDKFNLWNACPFQSKFGSNPCVNVRMRKDEELFDKIVDLQGRYLRSVGATDVLSFGKATFSEDARLRGASPNSDPALDSQRLHNVFKAIQHISRMDARGPVQQQASYDHPCQELSPRRQVSMHRTFLHHGARRRPKEKCAQAVKDQSKFQR